MFVRRICCPPAANWNKLAVFAIWAGFSMGECLSQLILDGLGFLGKEMALSPCARWTSRPAPAKPTEVYVHQTDRSLRHAVPHRSNHNAVSGQIFSSFTHAVVSLYVSFLIICWCELRKTFQEDSKHQAQCASLEAQCNISSHGGTTRCTAFPASLATPPSQYSDDISPLCRVLTACQGLGF